MDSTSEIGALIIAAAARGDLKELWVIKKKVDDDSVFERICDEYVDTSNGRNALHHAAGMGHLEICKFLIKTAKVLVDSLCFKRETPLMLAVEKESVKVVEYLIYQGAWVKRPNFMGLTALHYAVLKDNKEIIKLLLLRGADIDADSVDGGTPLQCAASRGNVEVVKLLLSCGAKQDLAVLALESPLVCAIKARSFEVMEALLEGQADPNKYSYGFSPLTYAAKERDTKYLKALVEAKADPNYQGVVRPIEHAALANNREGVEILFPLTEELEHVPEWSVDGIMEYCNSEEAQKQREESIRIHLAEVERRSEAALSKKNYTLAIHNLRIATFLDPSNPRWPSLRSLCHAHSSRRTVSLFDAAECLGVDTHLADPHHEDPEGADGLIRSYLIAGLGFVVNHSKWELVAAFRVSLFDLFASMYLRSTPAEILEFEFIPKTKTSSSSSS